MKIKLTKALIAILSVTFALTSCSKTSDELASVASTKQDILTFKTVEEFNTTVQKVNSMKPEERIAWEKSKGFKSFGTICDEVYRRIDPTKFKSLQEVKDTVNALSDYLEMGKNKDGKYYVDPKEYSNPAHYLMNVDKMYIIGTTVFKKFDNTLVSDNICNLEKLRMMNTNITSSNIVKQKVSSPPFPGSINYADLWGNELTVSGQKYVMRVILETNGPTASDSRRQDKYSFYNYKWTLWIYWGDYLSHTTSHIITRTIGYVIPEWVAQGKTSNIKRATYDNNDDYYVTRTLYAYTNENGAYPPYYLYYKIDVSNGRGCSLKAEYGTDYNPQTPNYYN